MTARFSAQHTVFSLIVTAGSLAALSLSLPLGLRLFLAGTYVLTLGAIAGETLFRDEARHWRVFFGTLFAVTLLMISGSALYYLWNLSSGAVAFSLLVTAAAVATIDRLAHRPGPTLHTPLHAPSPETAPRTTLWYVRLVGGLTACGISLALAWQAFCTLGGSATDISIRSPWDVVPRIFFILFFFAALAALTASAGGLTPRAALVPGTALAVLAVSVTALVYKVGFGFDPFIHRATEAAIFRDGSISPKPLYYVGQYVLVTVAARFGIDVSAADTWLVPAAFALLVPTAFWSLRKALRFSRAAAAAAASALLLLPLSSFAATTPQGLANVIFLLTVFCALPAVTRGSRGEQSGFPLLMLFALAGAAATIHPIAGVPLAAFVVIVALLQLRDAKHHVLRHGAKVAVVVLTVGGAIALPALFVINSILSGAGVELDTNVLRSPAAIIETLQTEEVITRQFSAIYDLVYSWLAWRTAVIVGLGALGLWVIWRRTRTGFAYALAAAMLLANYVLLKSVVQFSFLISYERSNYADRLLELTVFALAPLAAAAIAAVIDRAARHTPTVRAVPVVLLAAVMTSSVYLAYPRRDKYDNSRGWSTNSSDVEAVRLINVDAGGAPYVVLTNQSVSAAAVREFGFARYFASRNPQKPQPIFYYPIPTGDPLYQIFLDTNTDLGRRRSVEKAMDLAGVDTAYYVVSYYWWHAQEIILTARREADAHWNVNGKDYVFKYLRERK